MRFRVDDDGLAGVLFVAGFRDFTVGEQNENADDENFTQAIKHLELAPRVQVRSNVRQNTTA